MTKEILKKVLVLLISVMLMFTAFGGALAVFAEDAATEEPDWVGDFSGGATVSGNNALNKFYPNYGLYNAGFEQGLKYWVGRGTSVNNATLTNYVNLIETEGNNYVQFNGVTATAYSGLMTAKISVPATTFAQGDKATLVVDVYDPNNTMNNVQAVLMVYNGSTEVRLGQGTLNNAKVIDDKGNGWKTMLVPYTANTINFTSTQTSTVAEGDWAMALCFEVPTNKASTTAIDNIKIVKKVSDYKVVSIDGETIEWAPDWAGTFEGGALYAGASLNGRYPSGYGIANADFSKGLKYWGATGGSATSVTDYVDLVNDGDNYYIQFDGVAREGYCGFRTGYLCIPAADLQVGDYVALMFDIYDPDNTASAFQVVLDSRGCNSGRVSLTNGNALKVVTDHGNGWKTVVTEFDSAIVAACTEPGAFKSGDWVFSIAVEVIGSRSDGEGGWITEYKSTAAFDNFEIVKKIDEFAFKTMDGEIFDSAPDWAGTFEGGMSDSSDILNNYNSGDYIANPGFSLGLKFWGATGISATSVTDYAKLVKEDGNNYIRFDGVARTVPVGFRTPIFNIPKYKLYGDDYAAVMFDLYDPDNTAACFQIILECVNSDGSVANQISVTSGDELKVVEDKGNGWKTVITSFTAPIKKDYGSSNWQMRLMVEVKASAFDLETGSWIALNKTKAGFDNFEIIKKINNMTIQTMDGKTIEFECSHNYNSVVTYPTCTTGGYTTHTCTECGDSYVDSKVEAIGHVYSHIVTAPTCTKQGYTTHICNACSISYVDSYVGGAHTYGDWKVVISATPDAPGLKQKTCDACGDVFMEEIPALAELSFKSASVSLQSNLAFNFKVDSALFADGAYENPYVIFKMNDEEIKIDTYTVDGDKYVFTLLGISPDKMNDNVTATLYATSCGIEYTATKEYSVAEYCYSMLSQYADNASLRTLIVDLLNYGAASQIYNGYKIDNLVNAGLTAGQSAWGSSDVTLNNALNTKYETVNNATAYWKGAGLTLLENVAMRLHFKADSIDGLSVRITSANGEWNITSENFVKSGDYYYVVFDKFGADKMSENIYLTVMKDGAAISNTARYSIESYAYAKQNDSNNKLVDLVKAMMRYGNSAKNYK